MLSVIQARDQSHFDAVDELTWEYLAWGYGRLKERTGIDFGAEAAHRGDIAGRANYLPPKGRLLLAFVDGASAGFVRLRPLDADTGDTGEVKRLYVRPAYRSHGVGRELVGRLIQEARAIGYRRLVLDSAPFLKAGHDLYRRAGFSDIAPYAGNQIPERYRKNWVFMELPLTG